MENYFFLLLAPGMIAVIMGNAYSYKIKGILEENGYKTNLFSGHLEDLSNFGTLIHNENDQHKKKRYSKMLSRVWLSLIILVLNFGLVVIIMTWDLWSPLFLD